MSHDNQPVVCYRCEKAVERWRLERNPKTSACELEVDCHGEKDLVVFYPDERGTMPIVAFKPPEAEVCPTKRLLGYA